MKSLTFLLVILITLGPLLGSTGCVKRQHDGVPLSIVESISPSDGVSGVAPDTNVTIHFNSPVWVSQLPAPTDGQPLQLDSSELTDWFQIIDAATGEIVQGTVTIEDGTKLTFELPTDESWKPHTAYWIEGTVDASLEEAYGEGWLEKLFFSEFTTEHLDEDEFPVEHPFPGGWPELLSDIAYDVDTSQSLSFEELKAKIESARSKAKEANTQNQVDCHDISFSPNNGDTVEVGQCPYDFVTRFHFWPNIINLTEVYYAEDDHTLFNDILDQLLEKEPDRVQLKSDLTAQIVRGDRVFSACDFISSLWYGFSRFTEVYYGLLINLDNPDKTGARKPYVQEILVHDYSAYGLPLLHDPHTEELADMFNDPASVAIGENWDLCLRGNLKKSKYHAIIVDKLAEAPKAEFYIVRVHLNCYCNPFYDGPDSSIPNVPRKKKPPKEPVPEPVWEPQPLPNPNPPRNPHAPPNPQPGPGDPPVEPWPFPPDPMPPPLEDPIEPPVERLEPPEEEEEAKGCERPRIDCNDENAVEEKLEETRKKHEEAVDKRTKDLKTFEEKCKYDDELGWLEAIKTAEFNDPCLNELRDKLLEDLRPLLEEDNALNEQINELSRQIKDKEDNMDPVLKAWKNRSDLWGGMLHDPGPWKNIAIPVQPLVGAPGGAPVQVSLEDQAKFQKLIEDSIRDGKTRDGKTWEEAAKHAVTQTNKALPGGAASDAIGQLWAQYPGFLKMLYTKKLEMYLDFEYGDAITKDQRDKMIEVLFNGKGALTEAQIKEYQDIEDQVAELKAQKEALEGEVKKLATQMEEKRREFSEKATRCCFTKSLQNNLRLQQLEKILEAYLEWCKNPSDTFDIPYIQKYYEYVEGPWTRLCAVLCQIKDGQELDGLEFAGLNGLRSYAAWIYNCKCGGYECEDVVDPCDPECEDCTEEVQTPTPSPEIRDCVQALGYDTGIEDCLDGIFSEVATGDHVEFMEDRLSDFLASPDPSIPEVKRDCAQELIEFLDEAAEVDQEWAADIFVDSYFEAQEACRSDIVATEVLAAGLEASAQSIRDELGCRSTLTISFFGQDITGGSYPVTNVVLIVNGQVWHDSGSISTVHYQNSISGGVDCGETFNIEVTATNAIGLTVTATKPITTPSP